MIKGPGSNAGRNERRLLRTTRQLQKTKKEEEKKNLTATNVHAHQANVPSDLQPRANFEMTVAGSSLSPGCANGGATRGLAAEMGDKIGPQNGSATGINETWEQP